MISRKMAAFAVASLMIGQCAPISAYADNPMGYQMLSMQEAAALPHNHGALGLDVDRAQQITDGGMTFDIIRVKQVKRGSTGAQAGLRSGDEIIALDGHVFPTLVAFAAYIGSAQPGSQMMVDYMPAGSGPQKAQRVAVIVGQAGQPAPSGPASTSSGMSTGTKIAIGAGAVALLGCYEMGCFSHHARPANGQQPGQQPMDTQSTDTQGQSNR